MDFQLLSIISASFILVAGAGERFDQDVKMSIIAHAENFLDVHWLICVVRLLLFSKI